MARFKARINSRVDLYNCLTLWQQGLITTKDFKREITRVRNLNYDKAVVNEISSDRKTINVNYLAEAVVDGAARVGSVDVTIKSVTHNESEPDEHGNTSFVTSDIVVNKAVTAGATTFDLVNNPTIYERMGFTEEELDEVEQQLG